MKKILIALSAVVLFACGSSASDVTLYYVPGCPYCDHAKEFFANEMKGVKIEQVNVAEGGEKMRRFIGQLEKCNSQSRGVPLIIVKGECIQGFSPEVGARIKSMLGK